MSVFASINGVRMPVTSFDEADDSLRTDTRLITGGMHRDLTGGGRKQAWTTTLALMPLADALAWRALLEGRGFRWGFDTTLYSDKGLLMTSASSTLDATGGPFGGPALDVTATSSASFDDWPAWSVILWAKPGASWVHRVQTSDGEQYQDGSAWSYAWTATAGSGLALSSDHTEIADVLALPAVVPGSWADDLALSTRVMAPRPYCRLAGDCVLEDYVDVLGCDVGLRHVHLGDGVRRAVVSCTLREV